MKLPKLHERVMITQEATGKFGRKMADIIQKHEPELDESINALGQMIVNLTQEDKDHIIHSDYQKDLEALMDEISNEYNLSFGEKVSILINQIQTDTKYVIRWERHGDLSKEGGLE